MTSRQRRPRRPKISATRTSIAITPDIKIVLDWWVSTGAKSMSHGIQLLLEKSTGEPWNNLVDKARKFSLRCELHNEPLLLFDPSTEKAICMNCTSDMSQQSRSELMRYCPTHLSGYHRYCAMCEMDRSSRDIPVRSISSKDAFKLEEEGGMLVDVRRTKHTRGRITDTHDLMYMHFIDTRDGKLHDFLEGIAEDTPFILFDDDGEGRSHGAAAELVLRYGMENRVSIVNGGIVALRDTDPSRYLEDE